MGVLSGCSDVLLTAEPRESLISFAVLFLTNAITVVKFGLEDVMTFYFKASSSPSWRSGQSLLTTLATPEPSLRAQCSSR
jgi:hypothetical protein